MKRFLFILLPCLIIFICFIAYKNNEAFKVLKINSPLEIYVDYNKNLIFDEKEPFIYDNIFYIKSSSDYSSDEILSVITEEQKFLLEYLANDFAQNTLKNKFVSFNGNDLYIENKSYKNLLINSKFFYENNAESKKQLIKKLSEYNVSDYYILNLKSNKYHKLSCENGRKSRKYKIINKNLTLNFKKAKCCFQDKIQTPLKNVIRVKNKPLESYNIDNKIIVYFLDINSVFKPDNKCSTQACSTLKREIDNSKKSIDFAIYGFNNQPLILNSLINAQKRGVRIRWISNYDSDEDKYYPEIENLKHIFKDFKTNQNENMKSKYGIMHNKFFIFDGKKVFTGSANITSTDLSGFNANYSLLINSVKAAKIFENEFSQMYKGSFGNDKRLISDDLKDVYIDNNTQIKILFSPQSRIIDNYFIDYINNAKKYIYIPSFFITHKGILSALINAKNKGVDVKVINDATNSHTKYTIHKELRKNNIQVKTENYAGKMHMKSMVIDDEYSIVGSMNFTSSGNKRNDENVIIIKNSDMARYIKSTFIYLWEKIPSKYAAFDPKAESTESVGSCFDGIDNDFDNKTDSEDEGCFVKK